MSSEKIDLNDVSRQLDQTIEKKRPQKFFLSKQRVPTEQDKEAVSSYQNILSSLKNGVTKVTSFFHQTNKPETTSLGKPRESFKQRFEARVRSTSNQPLRNSKFNNATTAGQIGRCSKCSCCLKDGECVYCKKNQEIEIIDSDCEEFPSIEHLKTKPSKMSNQISTSSFYSKENTSYQSKQLNLSSRSNISITDDDGESIRYEIDYLYIGTCRFISRTYVRFSGEKLVLFINSGKEALNIDYKLVKTIFICESKSDNSKYTYLKIDFCIDAVVTINEYIRNFDDGSSGIYKYDSTNGHEKHFIMKLKYLQADEAFKLKKRLKIHLQNKLKEEPNIHNLFEEQRHYCLILRTRKKQKTSDNRATRNPTIRTFKLAPRVIPKQTPNDSTSSNQESNLQSSSVPVVEANSNQMSSFGLIKLNIVNNSDSSLQSSMTLRIDPSTNVSMNITPELTLKLVSVNN